MQTGPVRGNWWNSLQSDVHWPVFQPGKTGGGSGFRSGYKSVFVPVIRWFNLLACGGPAMVCLGARDV